MSTNCSLLRRTLSWVQSQRAAPLLLALFASALFSGCAGSKPAAKRVFHQGWIGGQYKQVHIPRFLSPHDTVNAFPAALSHTQKAGVLVMRLGTNAPAWAAGVREGDVLLQVNQQPVTSLRTFRRLVEKSQPGDSVAVKLWRDGKFEKKRICAGKESYRRQGILALGLFFHNLNFGLNPGFSLVVLGYAASPGNHIDLAAVDQEYVRKCTAGPYEPSEQDWAAWLAIIEVSKGKIILSQEPAAGG